MLHLDSAYYKGPCKKMCVSSTEKSNREETKNRDSKKKPPQLKKMLHSATQDVKVQESATEGKCDAGQVFRSAQAKKSDKIHPLKVKEAMSSVNMSTIADLEKYSTLKICFDRVGKQIIRTMLESSSCRMDYFIRKTKRQRRISIYWSSWSKETEVRILQNFFWPGLRQGVIRFCLSCDVCQRTIKKGTVKKVTLVSMPFINTPFKRVAVDILGPIVKQHIDHILTQVNYATTYPEAVPLKKITTEAVHLLRLTSTVEWVFLSVSCWLIKGLSLCPNACRKYPGYFSIKGLTSTPYHPICNRLVEIWNGTLKIHA